MTDEIIFIADTIIIPHISIKSTLIQGASSGNTKGEGLPLDASKKAKNVMELGKKD